MRIAIAEDETLPALTLHAGLKKAGYDVCKPVATGKKLLDLLETEDIDLIIMDMNLRGELKGLDVARMLKKNKNPSIIFVTGYEDEASRKNAMELEPLAFLVKPFVVNDIIDILKKVSLTDR